MKISLRRPPEAACQENGMDISGWVSHWASWTPGKPALCFEKTEISYRELEARVGRLAGLLRWSGTTRGDRVAYLGPNCPELVEVLFACARLGAIFVPLNARMPPAELRVFLQQSTPRSFLAEESFLQTARACAPELAAEVVAFRAGTGIAERAPAHSSPVDSEPEADPSAPLLILYTSGTTGMPKGAVMTHAALTAHALATVLALRMNASDQILTFTPMFHIAGLTLLTTPALFFGATVTVHRHLDPGSILHDIQDIPATLLLSPPSLTRELAAHPAWEHTDLTSLRCIVTGGTTVTQRSVRCWQQRGVPVIQSYGMTEAGANVTVVPGHDTPDKSLGFLDPGGYLHVVDRIKEIIIVGTSNVSPADLEAVLDDTPDIQAAAVVGRPDEELGEVPVAFVVPAPGRALTRKQVLSLFENRLAPYKHPREVVFLDALPRTPVGKPEKKTLRAMAHRGSGTPPASLVAQPSSS